MTSYFMVWCKVHFFSMDEGLTLSRKRFIETSEFTSTLINASASFGILYQEMLKRRSDLHPIFGHLPKLTRVFLEATIEEKRAWLKNITFGKTMSPQNASAADFMEPILSDVDMLGKIMHMIHAYSAQVLQGVFKHASKENLLKALWDLKYIDWDICSRLAVKGVNHLAGTLLLALLVLPAVMSLTDAHAKTAQLYPILEDAAFACMFDMMGSQKDTVVCMFVPLLSSVVLFPTWMQQFDAFVCVQCKSFGKVYACNGCCSKTCHLFTSEKPYAVYCSTACQRAHWKSHKAVCLRLQQCVSD